MKNNFKVCVSTYKRYYPLVPIFSYLFNKFWDNNIEVIILGYEPYPYKLPDNFKFVSMAPTQHNVFQWSTDIGNFMKSIDDEYIIFANEDLFIYDYVNQDLFNKICEYIPEVSCIGLTKAVETNSKFHVLNNNFMELDQQARCQCSLMWNIWKREYFLNFLPEGLSPWKVEGEGCEKAKGDNHRIISTHGDSIIRCAPSAIRRGQLHKPINFNFVNEEGSLDLETIQELRNLNYIDSNNIIKI